MKRMMNKVVLSCKRATELIEIEKYNDITFVEKFQLRLHLKMCDVCNKYNIQSKFIDKLIDKVSNIENIETKLNEKRVLELENKIIRKIDKI